LILEKDFLLIDFIKAWFLSDQITSFPPFLRKKVKKNCIIAFLWTRLSRLGRCISIWLRSCNVLDVDYGFTN